MKIRIMSLSMLGLGAMIAWVNIYAKPGNVIDPFNNPVYYEEHRDELDETNYEHLCFLAQAFAGDAALKQAHGEEGYVGDYNKAVSYYKKAIKVDSLNAFAYRGLAMIGYALKNTNQETIDYALKAIEMGWKASDVYLIAGLLMHDLNDERAIKYLSKANEIIESIDDKEIKKFDDYKKMIQILDKYEKNN